MSNRTIVMFAVEKKPLIVSLCLGGVTEYVAPPLRALELHGQDMPHRFELIPMPASRERVSLLAVDRAVSELRRGRSVVVRGAAGEAALIAAAEAVTPDVLVEMHNVSHNQPSLAITARRASVLGITETEAAAVILSSTEAWQAETVLRLADPLSPMISDIKKYPGIDAGTYSCATGAVGLAKLARLLPAALVSNITNPDADDLDGWCVRHGLLIVYAGDVFQYEHTAARTLKAVSDAKVPLEGAEDTKIVAFRPIDGGLEHLAIVIGMPGGEKGDEAVLARLHSECFTGDLLGSLRCDCGDQLRGAINEIAKSGGGVLLYLAQEGRGIGLVNKLRAYGLQDSGFDTMDANEQLGFDADERVYLPAAEMLRLLGYSSVRLMTNNPDKIEALAACGVDVVERVAHAFPSNRHNEGYLKTKAAKGGHLI